MKNYFISTNACCYDDFLRYYLNREFLKQMAVDNISDAQYSSVYGPFGKRIETAPYKKYELSANTGFVYPFNNWKIGVSEALTYEIIKNGSELLIEEFPNYQDLEEGKDIIEKI